MQARTPPAETQIAQAMQFIERAKKNDWRERTRRYGRQPRRCARQSPRRPRTSRQWQRPRHMWSVLRAQSAQPPTMSPSATSMQGVPMEAEVERVACSSCTIASPSSGPSRCEAPGRREWSHTFLHAQHAHSWRGVCMGGRVPRSDVGCGECGRPQSGFGVVEPDRSRSGSV